MSLRPAAPSRRTRAPSRARSDAPARGARRAHALLLTLALLSACGSTDPARFFVVTPQPPAQAAPPRALGVAVEPVRLPGAWDRAQFVTRDGPHELIVDEYTRWAEPLGDNLTRVLVENLAARLGSDQVYAAPHPVSDANTPYRLVSSVTRLDLGIDRPARLELRWQAYDWQRALVLAGHARPAASAPCAEHGDIAAALGEALALVSDEIAAALLEHDARGDG